MKYCDCNECNKCDCNDCCGGCKPAKYGCDFDIQASPYDPETWVVAQGGMSHKVKVPSLNETDTTLSTNYSNATLNYKAEKHTDKLTGDQIGDLINVGDLRDVDFDPTLDGHCYELIYRKFADCGEGCQSAADRWMNFNINSNGAKKDAIRYVRGANAYGCPVFLDVPTDLNEYWYAGWKTDGEHKEFGYYQATEGDLPKDSLGNYIVLSQDPNTKQPIVGTLPLDCILQNLVSNLGMNVYGTWSVIQETPGFSSSFNPATGDFTINWSDWEAPTKRVGYGVVYGKVNWDASFNSSTGTMNYHIYSIYFNNVVWTRDQGNTSSPINFTLKGVSIPDGAETTLIDHYVYSGNESWNRTLTTTIPCNKDISVLPGATVGPFNFAYVYVDWIGDDEGYLQINFNNKLSGWKNC